MIVIFGGTGTLGHALAEIIVDRKLDDVWIVSRCELRQKKMAEKYPTFNYVIGDITNKEWERKLPRDGRPIVFNLAAMKHVEIAENNVLRCVEIDFYGTVNTFQWASDIDACQYVFTGTDKSVLPINAYGMAKGLSERYLQENIRAGIGPDTSICKWPNVLGSRGSVLHVFKRSLEYHSKVRVTDLRMTRFFLHIDDVAEFMWDKSFTPSQESPHIPPNLKGCKIVNLAHSVARVLGIDKYDVEEIGIRPGEKIHEVMKTGHDYCLRSDNCEQYTDDELDALVERCFNDSTTWE